MIGNSRSVVSPQQGPHEDLARRLERYRTSPWRRPVAAHGRTAFETLASALDPARPVVLDAGCGTGDSTHRLAALHPGAQIVGVDKSAHRLARAPTAAGGSVHLVRADLQDFWRLARERGWRLAAHYLLYPNPWPKVGHLQRRWHAHPVFPELLALGGALELRTNWPVYAEEFAAALACYGVEAQVDALGEEAAAAPLSPFERKYLASGQRCLRVCADLDAAGGGA